MITKIRYNLYLGSAKDAIDEANILKYNITHVLNVAEEIKEVKYTKVGYTKLAFKDRYDDIENSEPAIKKLISLLNSNEAVLVHCKAGKSRSPHVVAEALAKIENKPYEDIYKDITKVRDILNVPLKFAKFSPSIDFRALKNRLK